MRHGYGAPVVTGFWRNRDVGFGYALVLLVIAIAVFAQPSGVAGQAVLNSSTNLHNLRTEPLSVLFLSAFVLDSPWDLWVLPLLIGVYGCAQRWLGRAATVLVAASGHVFSTMFVALLVNAGIANHQLSRRLANEPDVGVSYGLAALLGVLAFRLRPPVRRTVALGSTALLLAVMAVSQTFTDLGHLVAWSIGLTMGFVGSRLAEAQE